MELSKLKFSLITLFSILAWAAFYEDMFAPYELFNLESFLGAFVLIFIVVIIPILIANKYNSKALIMGVSTASFFGGFILLTRIYLLFASYVPGEAVLMVFLIPVAIIIGLLFGIYLVYFSYESKRNDIINAIFMSYIWYRFTDAALRSIHLGSSSLSYSLNSNIIGILFLILLQGILPIGVAILWLKKKYW